MDSIHDITALDNHIWEVVQEYIENQDNYPSDVVLAIDNDTLEVYIESPKNIATSAKQYQLAELIRQDEKGCPEPDCDATNNIACKYFFVR